MNSTLSTKAAAYLSAATSIAQALAADAETIASGTGNTALAGHIAKGLSTFQGLSGPIQDVEQMAVSLFGFFGQLAAGHAASQATPTAG